MTSRALRGAWIAVIAGCVACARPAAQRVEPIGPMLGESTAPGPSNPSAPLAKEPGVTEVSVRLQSKPVTVARPAPSTGAASSSSTPAPASQGMVVIPGVTTGPAPAGAAPSASSPTGPTTGAAGPNGPGTGNGRPTPVGP